MERHRVLSLPNLYWMCDQQETQITISISKWTIAKCFAFVRINFILIVQLMLTMMNTFIIGNTVQMIKMRIAHIQRATIHVKR